MTQGQRQNTYSTYGENTMQDVYELEEYHHDGKIGAFIKTRQCAEELFDEVIEPRIRKLENNGAYFHLYRKCGDLREVIL